MGSMIHGNVTRAWAWTFHRTWYYEVTGKSRPKTMIHAKWDRRIRRATELTSSYPSPRKDCASTRVSQHFRKAFTRKSRKLWRIRRRFPPIALCETNWIFSFSCQTFPGFLSLIQQIAPVPLAQAAAELAQKGPAGWQHAIEDFWHGDFESARGRGRHGASPGRRFARCHFFRSIARVDVSFNPTPNILPTTAKARLWTEPRRPARCAAASPSSAYCGAKATARRNR